jgi:hypothetical protein
LGILKSLLLYADMASFHSHMVWLFLIASVQISIAVFISFFLLKFIVLDILSYRNSVKTINYLLSNDEASSALFKKLENGVTLYTFDKRELSVYFCEGLVVIKNVQKVQFAVIYLKDFICKAESLKSKPVFGMEARLNLFYKALYGETEKLNLRFNLKKAEYEPFYQLSHTFTALEESKAKDAIRSHDLDSLHEVKVFWQKYEDEVSIVRNDRVKEYIKLLASFDKSKKLNRQTIAYAIAETILSQNQLLQEQYNEIKERALALEHPYKQFAEEEYSEAWEEFLVLIKRIK